MAAFPTDYSERVYAGVLGKLVGVYSGRPFEGWTYQRITQTMGDVSYYVHERFGKPLVVTDDDISGTFTFLRAFQDNNYDPHLTSEQIGQTWLNYLIERRTILWWGGVGNSTEHTAYLRLKQGIPAPQSGSISLNGATVAEQIGAQIFIDGWAMVCPGDPERAVHYAGLAARVSHDGEAVYGAQVIAAMESLAFVERDIHTLLNTATGFIPRDSTIYRLIADLREWHAKDTDWRSTRQRLEDHYGYDKYPGICLCISNTSGWDTDCNSGNVGCFIGIRNGLAAFGEEKDWRSPVADRLYISSADGGRSITDAVQEALHIVQTAHRIQRQPYTAPKARFNFMFPGSTQGFQTSDAQSPVSNVVRADGERWLAANYTLADQWLQVFTSTFPGAQAESSYQLIAAPTLYPTQQIEAVVEADQNGTVRLFVRGYDEHDTLIVLTSSETNLTPGQAQTLSWVVPSVWISPIIEVGIEFKSERSSTLFLNSLTWHGTPTLILTRPQRGTTRWHSAWMNGVDHLNVFWDEPFRPTQNNGRGLIAQGTREWSNYRVEALLTPHLMRTGGVAAYIQGMRRYYALLLSQDRVRLVKMLNTEIVLAEAKFPIREEQPIALSLEVFDNRIRATLSGNPLFDVVDPDPLTGGAAGYVVEEGSLSSPALAVTPVTSNS
jgi:ADP-ribosylglycohydrolase